MGARRVNPVATAAANTHVAVALARAASKPVEVVDVTTGARIPMPQLLLSMVRLLLKPLRPLRLRPSQSRRRNRYVYERSCLHNSAQEFSNILIFELCLA